MLAHIHVFPTEFHVKSEGDTPITYSVDWWRLCNLPRTVISPQGNISAESQGLTNVFVATYQRRIGSPGSAPHVPPPLLHVESVAVVTIEFIIHQNILWLISRADRFVAADNFDVIQCPVVFSSIVIHIALAESKRGVGCHHELVDPIKQHLLLRPFTR